MTETKQQRDERRYSYECNVIRENRAQFATFSYPSDAKKVCGVLNRTASDEAARMVTVPRWLIEALNTITDELRKEMLATHEEQSDD